MIFELPNFVSVDALDFINSEIEKHYDNPKLSAQKPFSYRDGKSINVSGSPELKNLDDFLVKIFASEELLSYIIRRYNPKYETADTGYEFHRYRPNELCHIHADGETTFRGDIPGEEVCLRFASVVLHLNTPSSGGELVFPTLNKTVKTEAGKIVIFPPYGFAQHYTNPSSSNRDVIVSWFVYKNLLVRHR